LSTAAIFRPSSLTPSHEPSVTDQPTTAFLPIRLTSPLAKQEPVQTAQVRASTYSPRIAKRSPSADSALADRVRIASISPCFMGITSSSQLYLLYEIVEAQIALAPRLAALALVHGLVVGAAAGLRALAPVGLGVHGPVEARDDGLLLGIRGRGILVEHVLRPQVQAGSRGFFFVRHGVRS